MFCPNCGKELKPGSKFCGECGHKLDSIPGMGVPQNPKLGAVSVSSRKIRDLNFFAHQKIQLKWELIFFFVFTILLTLFHWVHFVGNLNVSYNPITLHAFAVDHEDYLYWILYDIWDHDGAEHFGAFALAIRWAAIAAIALNVVAIWSFLTDQKSQYLMGISATASAQVVSLIFLMWMWWFKVMLVKYEDLYDYNDVFHFTWVPYAVFILSCICQGAIIQYMKKLRNHAQREAAEKITN